MLIRVAVLATTLVACAGSTTAAPTPSPNVLSVAGNYPTVVTLVSDACGGSIVQSMPTDVVHVPGALTVALDHAGSRYAGTLAPNGVFQTTPAPLVIGTVTYVVTVAGQFSISGFDATATVDKSVAGTPGSCRYVAHWVGTRSSGVNALPGS